MSDVSFDCVSCGARCFSRNPRYLERLPWDAARALPPESLFTEDGRTFVRFEGGHCVHLQLAGGKAVCGVYEDRPEACRAFRAGSFECGKARRANGASALARASEANDPGINRRRRRPRWRRLSAFTGRRIEPAGLEFDAARSGVFSSSAKGALDHSLSKSFLWAADSFHKDTYQLPKA